jgi:hypothetical protein
MLYMLMQQLKQIFFMAFKKINIHISTFSFSFLEIHKKTLIINSEQYK